MSVRMERQAEGLLIDFAADGRAVGIEIAAPSKLSLDTLNHALSAVHQDPATPDELGPLAAA